MVEEVPGTIALGIISLFLLWFSWKRKLFRLVATDWKFPICWYHVVVAFLIYFLAVTIGASFLISFVRAYLNPVPSIGFSAWLSFLSSTIIFFCISFYLSLISREVSIPILHREKKICLLKDLKVALLTWLIAFPLVLFLNQLLDFFLYYAFHVQELPDQLAVRFLKMTFQYPKYFFLSIFTIVVFAPIIEELLFRGFLQSFVRQYFSAKSAIIITSLLFSLFHYSSEQGIANLSIIGSLFFLSLFLGFVYEKQGSIAAPMFLHAAFNTINVINLYFLRES